MTQRTGYIDGEPCWVDLTTPDLAAARSFYGALFGWTFAGSGPDLGSYTMAQIAGDNVAGLAPPAPGFDGPTLWNLYLQTSDIEATHARADAAGAKVLMPPTEVPGAGRMLYGFDPTGAAFGVWQPAGHIGAQRQNEPGAFAWAELMTRDGPAADDFYARLFPYRQEQIGDGVTFDYTVWRIGSTDPLLGRWQVGTDQPIDVAPQWKIYFAVPDADRAAERIQELGGTVPLGPQDSPYGRIANVTDPQGAGFAVIDTSKKTAM